MTTILVREASRCGSGLRTIPSPLIVSARAAQKEACYQRVAKTIKYCISNDHSFIYGCPLCATGVPCESGIPEALR